MKIIGLTGGIGMGKSTVAKMLRDFGFPVFSADKAVHEALKKGGKGVAPVAKVFPETLKNGRISHDLLGRIVFSNPRKLQQLEKILHPVVKQSERAFLSQARSRKNRVVVLEIPLLFETGADARCDIVLCVSAPPEAQKARVLARPRMTKEKFLGILARQMPDTERCGKANYVVPTGISKNETKTFLRELLGERLLLDPRRPSKPVSRQKPRACQR